MAKDGCLTKLAAVLGGRLHGADVRFGEVSIDTRTLSCGQLFVALAGEHFDGHDWLAAAKEKGAAAALVEQVDSRVDLPQLQVDNCRAALAAFAAWHRAAWQGKLIALTGSSGKTTVKELLAAILKAQFNGAVCATKGNLNNDLGVPLTLLQLTAQHQAAVIELGANHVGEIAASAALARPQVALITNAGSAHLGEFGSLQKIVDSKGEILDALAEDGVAVLNLDYAAFSTWQARAGGRRVLSFSLTDGNADCYAQNVRLNENGCAAFTLHSPAGQIDVQLQLHGLHQVANALAAATAAHALNVPLAVIGLGLQSGQPMGGRGKLRRTQKGQRLIDDSYNANPAALHAAVDLLATFSGRRVLVLGDMGELGAMSEASHREIGCYASGKVDALYAIGPMMAHAVRAFIGQSQYFEDFASLIAALNQQSADSVLLVKGSRSAQMDKVVSALCGDNEGTH